jgi:hypothetical protein
MWTTHKPALLLAAWTLLVWTTRIGNILGDDGLDSGEKAGRTALALSFTALAVLVVWAVLARSARRRLAVLALAGWSLGVWVVRAVGIVGGDHSAGFIAVHVVLAAVSIALSWLAVRTTGGDRSGSRAATTSR